MKVLSGKICFTRDHIHNQEVEGRVTAKDSVTVQVLEFVQHHSKNQVETLPCWAYFQN